MDNLLALLLAFGQYARAFRGFALTAHTPLWRTAMANWPYAVRFMFLYTPKIKNARRIFK
ncbi:MAG: hypothetical protein II767_09820 [Proteobacteria bacterium]|nr:hypothetical protein [Pseudomonadota bacterium]